MIDEQWIFNEEFEKAGLKLEDAAFINIIKGLSEPSGFYEKKSALKLMYPESIAMMQMLEKIIEQHNFRKTVRILPDGRWWFPCQWSEKLGVRFNPKKRNHMNAFLKLIQAGIHPSEVKNFYWHGLDEVPMEQYQNKDFGELVELIQEKTPYALY